MADNSLDSLGSLIGLVSSLKKMAEPRGVANNTPGSIIKQEEKETVDPSLDSNEISRLEKVATILGKTFIKLGVFKGEETSETNEIVPLVEVIPSEKTKPVISDKQSSPTILKKEVLPLPERVLPTILKKEVVNITRNEPIAPKKEIKPLAERALPVSKKEVVSIPRIESTTLKKEVLPLPERVLPITKKEVVNITRTEPIAPKKEEKPLPVRTEPITLKKEVVKPLLERVLPITKKEVVNTPRAEPITLKKEVVKPLPERVLSSLPTLKKETVAPESRKIKEKELKTLVPSVKAIDIKPIIIKQEQKEQAIDSNLRGPEISRYEKIADIFGRVLGIGKYTKGPEASRLGDLTPDKPSSYKAIEKSNIKVPALKPDTGGLLSLLGLSGIWSMFKDQIKMWLLKQLGNVFSWVGRQLWSALKGTLNLLGKGLRWTGKQLLTGILKLKDQLLKWGSKLLESIKGTSLYKAVKESLVNAGTALKSTWASAKTGIIKFFTELAENITKLKDAAIKAVANLPGVKAAKQLVKSAVTSVDSTAANVLKSVSGATQGVVSATKTLASKAADSTAGKAITSATQGAVSATKTLSSKAAGSTFSKAATGVSKAASSVTGSASKVVGKVATSVIDKGKDQIGNWSSKFFTGSAGKIGTLIKGIPILSALIESALAAKDIMELQANYVSKKITADELQLKAGKRVAEGIAGVGGAALGTVVGTALGGPIGTIVGGVGGDLLGRYLGDLFVEKVLSPNITKKLGAFVTNTAPKEELQDYIMQNGTITPFSSKDQVLGMKTGGAIDNLLNDFANKSANTSNIVNNISNSVSDETLKTLSTSTASYNDFAKSALTKQINQQERVIDLLIQLIKKPVGGNTTVQNMPQSNINTSQSNFRDAFSQQTLVV